MSSKFSSSLIPLCSCLAHDVDTPSWFCNTFNSHGNGTQQIFYENPNVLYISLHRWDNGHFYPFTGAPDECGEEAGEGKNVNIAWSSYGRGQAMGDVEYIAAFWYVLLPIARQFQPDLVMVSAGFDAADGHAANVSFAIFAHTPSIYAPLFYVCVY